MIERENRTERRAERRRGGRLVLGLFLMLLGALLVADNLGLDLPAGVWSYWPYLLIALGVGRLVFDEGEGRGGGYWLLLAGVYCWLSVFHVAGLAWATAWPVYLVGIGLWIVIGRFVCATGSARPQESGDAR